MGPVSRARRQTDRPHPSAASRLLPSPTAEGLKSLSHRERITPQSRSNANGVNPRSRSLKTSILPAENEVFRGQSMAETIRIRLSRLKPNRQTMDSRLRGNDKGYVFDTSYRHPCSFNTVSTSINSIQGEAMTKSIHIARPDVHEMAKELARLKGTTIVAAVSEALRNRFDEIEAEKKAGIYRERPDALSSQIDINSAKQRDPA